MKANQKLQRSDGAVVSSSQLTSSHWRRGDYTFPMVGIILYVHPADSQGNLSAETNSIFLGHRHECTVLAGSNRGSQVDELIQNVIIPPGMPSGVDNYHENLPRGVGSLANAKDVNFDWKEIDPLEFDAEWCVIGFIGGKRTIPFLMNWWPHPTNTFDVSTSGFGWRTDEEQEGKALPQYDLEKNRGRMIWRKNGTLFLLSKTGTVYLDTNYANRKVEVTDGKPNVSKVEKGGHVQIDMKPTAQTEVNWNEKPETGPQLGAASDTKLTVLDGATVLGEDLKEEFGEDKPVHEDGFPHYDQPLPDRDNPEPEPRATDRTYIRGKEYEVIAKTSKLALVAQTNSDGSVEGEIDLLVDKLIKLKCGENITLQAVKNIEESSGADHIISSPLIHVGSAESDEPLVLGNLWIDLMGRLIDAIKNITVATPVGPSVAPVINFADFDSLKSEIEAKTQVSDFVFSQKEPPG